MSKGLLVAFDAAIEGDAQAVAAWLDKGGSVDAGCTERKGATLLMRAAVGGHEAVVRMLLQRGASVNLQAFFGATALMNAALNGHAAIVQALLDAKANTSLQTESGYTALMWAENLKQTAAAQLLRQHTKQRDEAKKGDAMVVGTVLYDAAFEGDAPTAVQLLHSAPFCFLGQMVPRVPPSSDLPSSVMPHASTQGRHRSSAVRLRASTIVGSRRYRE